MTTTPTQFLDRYLELVNAADPAGLVALYAPEARVFDAMMAWEVSGDDWSTQINYWLKEVRPGGTSRVADLAVAESGYLAVLSATITYESELLGGGPATCTLRFTLVVTRDGDDWRILHEHSSYPVTMDQEPKIITHDPV